MKQQNRPLNIIITSDYNEIKHLKFSEIQTFRVKNGVYKVLLKDRV